MSSSAGAYADDQGTELEGVADDPAQEAKAAVQIGLYISAVRCLLTYVVAPVAGSVGILLGPIGVILLLVGAVTSAAGARRLWLLGSPARIPYAALALAVFALLVFSVGEIVWGLLS